MYHIHSFRAQLKTLLMCICKLAALLTGQRLKPAILMYHSFDSGGWKHGVDPEVLKKQINFLVKQRNLVPLEDVVSYAKGEQVVPKDSVAVTVDDGYEDTYSVLFPLAKEFGFSFTIFLTTDLSEMKKLGSLPRPTWEQLQEMIDSGLVTIGLHGHTHTNFPKVFVEGNEKTEIIDSKSLISRKLGVDPTVVAYPAGRYNDEVCRYMQTHFCAALSTHQGHLQVGDDVYMLKRVLVDRATTFGLFKARLQPGYEVYLRLLQKLRKIYA